MNVGKAIEIKETELDGSVEHTEEELRKAERLSVEALKLIDNLRFDSSPYYPNLLPGETEA